MGFFIYLPCLQITIVNKLNNEYQTSKKFSTDSINKLLIYDLPGNIRELQHIVKSAYFSSNNNQLIYISLNASDSSQTDNDLPDDEQILTLEEVKLNYIKKILIKIKNNKKASVSLGISEQQIYNIIKKHNLQLNPNPASIETKTKSKLN